MFRTARLVASAGALAALAACTQPTSPPPPTAATVPAPVTQTAAAASPGSFDGTYRGSGTGNSRCGGTQTFARPIRVANGVASVQSSMAGTIEGPIGPDGSLMVEHGRENLRGQFSGNTFTGTFSFNSCVYTMNYAKR